MQKLLTRTNKNLIKMLSNEGTLKKACVVTLLSAENFLEVI